MALLVLLRLENRQTSEAQDEDLMTYIYNKTTIMQGRAPCKTLTEKDYLSSPTADRKILMAEGNQNNPARTMDARRTQFSDLPSDLVVDILLRLPIKTQLICRFVRKDWNQLYFSDPNFVKRQLASSPIHLLDPKLCGIIRFGRVMDETGGGGGGGGDDGEFDGGEGEFDDDDDDYCLPLEEAIELPFKHKLPSNIYKCTNSCNGLLCLVPKHSRGPHMICNPIIVCNPILGELVSISPPAREYSKTAFALGFSTATNQYKVLHSFRPKDDNSWDCRFEIYTLGTRRWRSIANTLGCCGWHSLRFNTFLHGSLHWTSWNQDLRREEIAAFDFENEKFRRFSLPRPHFTHNLGVRLGVVNGCLWASFYSHFSLYKAEMWAMKKYGVQESWTKMLVCEKFILPTRNFSWNFYDLLFSLNKEEILMGVYGDVVSFNTKRKRARDNPNFGFGFGSAFGFGSGSGFGGGGPTAYNPSFVSLQDVAKGEQGNL